MKPYILSLILALGLMGCRRDNEPKPPQENPLLTKLRAKADLYLRLADLDEAGWIKDTKCDGLLFNSLYAASGGVSDPLLARNGDGQWFRHHLKDCYPNGSASTISRDMFMGVFLWIWKHKRRDVVEQIISYGEANDWLMGQGDPFRTRFRLSTKGISYDLRFELGGADHGLRHVPEAWFDVNGYEAHLQVLHILLSGLMHGGISNATKAAIKDHARKEPQNALFQAVHHKYHDGDQSIAIAILLDERLFPADRLPSSDDRCEMYLWQRDYKKGDGVNPDWLPCPGRGEVFSGVDFLIAKAVILNEL